MLEFVNHRPEVTGESIRGIVKGQCMRCLSKIKPHDVDASGRLYCRECLSFGIIREDTILYRCRRFVPNRNHTLVPSFPLSASQKEASSFVVDCLKHRQNGFLYAVCGAGKTEILYEAFHWAFQNGWRICLAIPRRDIVLELGDRLRTVFPDTSIKLLHQNAKDDEGAHLVISTVHQLIRYHQEFDWIVLDEADAFPYRDDPLLHRLLIKALQPTGSLFLMSATINPDMKRAIRQKRFRIHTLSGRFHGHPLDLPERIWVPDLSAEIRQGDRLPHPLTRWFSSCLQHHRQALVFVPSISMGEQMGKLLCDNGFDAGVLSSRSAKREDIIARFRQKEWPFLITTTLLERGVTFRDIDVAVISADHAVFDYDTLVQISGRVGRDPEHPKGSILLFSEEQTDAMRRAEQYIRRMNRLSRESGLIGDGL